jgi:hypothetical protein
MIRMRTHYWGPYGCFRRRECVVESSYLEAAGVRLGRRFQSPPGIHGRIRDLRPERPSSDSIIQLLWLPRRRFN